MAELVLDGWLLFARLKGYFSSTGSWAVFLWIECRPKRGQRIIKGANGLRRQRSGRPIALWELFGGALDW